MFIPLTDECYYCIEINSCGLIDIDKWFWENSENDVNRLREHNIFQSKPEAEIVAEKIRELLKNQ